MKQVTGSTYYRCSLALPLVVPLMETILRWLAGKGNNPFVAYAPDLSFLSLSIVYGGIPYAFLALGLLHWSWRKTEHQIFIQTWLSPLWMAGLMCFGNLVLSGMSDSSIRFNGLITGCALVFGYAYVIGVNGGLWLLRMLSLILPPED